MDTDKNQEVQKVRQNKSRQTTSTPLVAHNRLLCRKQRTKVSKQQKSNRSVHNQTLREYPIHALLWEPTILALAQSPLADLQNYLRRRV